MRALRRIEARGERQAEVLLGLERAQPLQGARRHLRRIRAEERGGDGDRPGPGTTVKLRERWWPSNRHPHGAPWPGVPKTVTA